MNRILKPALWKLLLTTALLFISSALWRAYVVLRISDTFPIGFPFQFYLSWGPCQPGQNCSESKWLFLIFDMIIWYAISAVLVDRVGNKQIKTS